MREQQRSYHTLYHTRYGAVQFYVLKQPLYVLVLLSALDDLDQPHQLRHPVQPGQARQPDQLVVTAHVTTATTLIFLEEVFDELERDYRDKVEGKPTLQVVAGDDLGLDDPAAI